MLRIEGTYEQRKVAMIGTSTLNNDEKTCWALLVYAIQMASNAARNGGTGTQEEQKDSMRQHMINAVQGHSRSRQVFDTRWRRT